MYWVRIGAGHWLEEAALTRRLPVQGQGPALGEDLGDG